MTDVTCRLTAKNRDKLRNPTLGNRVWATFISSLARIACIAYVRAIAADDVKYRGVSVCLSVGHINEPRRNI